MGRTLRHCSDNNDCTKKISLLCQRLIDIGHNPSNLTLIFKEATSKLQKQHKLKIISAKTNTTQKLQKHQRLLLHPLEKHARNLQQNFRTNAVGHPRCENINYRMSPTKNH